MNENARNRLVWELQSALQDLQKTALGDGAMFRSVHAEVVMQSLLLTIAESIGDDEIKILLEQVNEAWGKDIVGKREN